MSENQVVVTENRGRLSLKSRYNQVVIGAVAAVPLFANAAEGIDTTAVLATIALGAAAVGALGAAKIAPAALTWVWSLVTGMAKRG